MRVNQLEVRSINRNFALLVEQPKDRADALDHPLALRRRIYSLHARIGGQRARTASEHHASACQMVEQGEAVGDVKWVMIRDADHAGSKHDVPGARRGHRHENLGRRDYFPSRRMMLADERLFVAELVEPFDQLHVALEAELRVFADAMKRGHENSELHHFSLIGTGLKRRSGAAAVHQVTTKSERETRKRCCVAKRSFNKINNC